MDLGAIRWRGRLGRRVPLALVAGQVVLATTWLVTIDSACLEPRGCGGPLPPRDPSVLALATGAAIVVLVLSLVVPRRWLDWLAGASPTAAAVLDADRWIHLGALGVFMGAAVLIPRLFLGDLRVDGLVWVALAAPAWPALLAFFGSLTLAVSIPPTIVATPEIVFLTMGILLLVVVGIVQVLWYYGAVLGAVRLGRVLRRRVGSVIASRSAAE